LEENGFQIIKHDGIIKPNVFDVNFGYSLEIFVSKPPNLQSQNLKTFQKMVSYK